MQASRCLEEWPSVWSRPSLLPARGVRTPAHSISELCALKWSLALMFVFGLFAPASRDGMIFCLRRATSLSYSAFRWDVTSRTWIHGEMGMDQFMALSGASANELIAAGWTTSDLSQ